MSDIPLPPLSAARRRLTPFRILEPPARVAQERESRWQGAEALMLPSAMSSWQYHRNLHSAVSNGCWRSVTYLLQRGEDPNEPDSWGNAPLHLAAIRNARGLTNCPTIFTVLLSKGASVHSHNQVGDTALLILCRGERKLDIGILQMLLECGADPGEQALLLRDRYEDTCNPTVSTCLGRTTALMMRVQRQDTHAVKCLLANGADPFASVQNSEGRRTSAVLIALMERERSPQQVILNDLTASSGQNNSSEPAHEDREREGAEKDCFLCLEGVVRLCILVPCGHGPIHQRCAEGIISNSSKCPICRSEVYAAQRAFIS